MMYLINGHCESDGSDSGTGNNAAGITILTHLWNPVLRLNENAKFNELITKQNGLFDQLPTGSLTVESAVDIIVSSFQL